MEYRQVLEASKSMSCQRRSRMKQPRETTARAKIAISIYQMRTKMIVCEIK